MKNLNLIVEGMKCNGCVSKIELHFKEQEMIDQVNINLDTKEIMISGDDSLSNMSIKKEIEELGFNVISIKKV